MKKMLLIISGILLMVVGAKAQTSFGLKAGVNFAKFSGGEDVKNKSSFQGTAFVDIPISKDVSFQPGLSLQSKGYKARVNPKEYYGDEFPLAKGTSTVDVLSLEIPMNFLYYMPSGPGKFFIGAGPYIGLNLSGKAKLKGTEEGTTLEIKNNIKFSGTDKEMNQLDAGANILFGYKLNKGLLLNAGYNVGLANLIPDAAKTVSNRVLSFAVGFQF